MSNARESEAKMEPAVVEFRGHTFTVARDYDDWSIDLVESIEDGKSVGIVRGALGTDQWMIVKAMDLKVRDLNELGDIVAKSLGFGSTGESEPSGS